ncbi:hypothetical protein GCM10009801_16840 [Streptomyces albiaxialis]|uniref:Peptidase S26 domain-containing protein n=1 Tax=Streptomyces albiaxialis TaxID=329523 RepID=A0ABN2VQE1_9ACTN
MRRVRGGRAGVAGAGAAAVTGTSAVTAAVTAAVAVTVVGAVLARRALALVTVRGRSMEPTFHDGDLVLVVRTRALSAGRIVVVERPAATGGWSTPPLGRTASAAAVHERQWMIKRVAAAPGALPPPGVSGGRVPPGQVVLLGDNPRRSVDSRQLGHFPAARVLGVTLRVRATHRPEAVGGARTVLGGVGAG